MNGCVCSMEGLCYSFLTRVGGCLHWTHMATLTAPPNLVLICEMGVPCPQPHCELIWVLYPTDQRPEYQIGVCTVSVLFFFFLTGCCVEWACKRQGTNRPSPRTSSLVYLGCWWRYAALVE